MGISEAIALVRTACDRPALPPVMAEQVRAVVDPKLALYEAVPDWCVPELPRRTLRALGGPEALGDGLAASCLLYHCAADVIDDAQDHDLAGWGPWGWEHAVNVGLYLLSAHGAFLAGLEAPDPVKAAWARAFGEAGCLLTIGQHDDFAAGPDAPWDEADVLTLGARKAGAAVAAFTSLAAIWAGRDDVEAWRTLGFTLGQCLQVASDLEAYLIGYGTHPDLAAAKLTLPLLYARDMDPELSALWRSGLPLAAADQQALRERVCATGAVIYARMRVEILQREAEQQIVALGVPALKAELAPILATANLSDEPAPI